MSQTSVLQVPKDGKPTLEYLLSTDKTIRDPIHGDILINHLETKIIDTKDFQRLRHIRQLGTSYLVYPGVQHTRFEHSLGTLHMAQKMIDAINNNRFGERKIGVENPYEILLTRLCALLHDIVNIPFGHTLESEGNLYLHEWKDDKRVKYFMNPDRDIGKIIIENINETCRTEIIKIMTAKKEDEIQALKYPFISDIVGNTICADLLDYLKRDIYYAGLKEAYDDRFLKYLFITEKHSPPNRLAIRLIGKRKQLRRDILSEILHLLRLRYSLGEKVYFHRAKSSTSAMIISAVNTVKDEISDNVLYDSGDDIFIEKIKALNSEITTYVLDRYEPRTIYRRIYGHPYKPRMDTDNNEIDRIIDKYRVPKNREDLERKLEKWSDAPKGSVIIHCPDSNMALKAAAVKVLWSDDKIYPLESEELGIDYISDEIKAIKKSHLRLWNISVFVDRKLCEVGQPVTKARLIASDFAKETKLENKIEKEYPEDQEPWYSRQTLDYINELKATNSEIRNLEFNDVRTIVSELAQDSGAALGPEWRERGDIPRDFIRSLIETILKKKKSS